MGVFPPTIFGLPVMSVSSVDAALAAGQLDGRFAAVGGFLREAPPSCFLVHTAPIVGVCTGVDFADTPKDANPASAGDSGTAPIPMPETWDSSLLSSNPSAAPVPVVLVVHAADSRAWQCFQSDCRKTMVIDAVAMLNGAASSTSDANAESDVQPKLKIDGVIAAGVETGEQLVVAYALDAVHLNSVDPRQLGKGTGTVWLVRVAQSPASDGTAAGTVRLISDSDGSVLAELPLSVDAGYDPGRLLLDSHYSDNTVDTRPQFKLLDGSTVLAGGTLNSQTAPIAVEAGSYTLDAYLVDAPQASGATCNKSISVAAGVEVGYKAAFSGSSCTWTTFDSSTE